MLFFLPKSYIFIGDIMLDRLYDYVSDNEFRFTVLFADSVPTLVILVYSAGL